MAGDAKVVKKALAECRKALVKGIDARKPTRGDVDTFINRFKSSFENALPAPPPNVAPAIWARDREHVTALAHAIGALAQFFATSAGHRRVGIKDLDLAYRTLSPFCQPFRTREAQGRLKGQYCTNYPGR